MYTLGVVESGAMGEFVCIYYQTNSGRMPVKEFIYSLHQRTRQKYYVIIGLLEDFGKTLPKPHADYLEDGIYEIRFVGIEGQVRIFYFFYFKNKIILTNGFIKKQRKAPKLEVKLAKERRNHYIEQDKE